MKRAALPIGMVNEALPPAATMIALLLPVTVALTVMALAAGLNKKTVVVAAASVVATGQ